MERQYDTETQLILNEYADADLAVSRALAKKGESSMAWMKARLRQLDAKIELIKIRIRHRCDDCFGFDFGQQSFNEGCFSCAGVPGDQKKTFFIEIILLKRSQSL